MGGGTGFPQDWVEGPPAVEGPPDGLLGRDGPIRASETLVARCPEPFAGAWTWMIW